MTKIDRYERLISFGAIVALAGFVLSGPVAFIVVRLISPQPEWISPEVFSQHYNIIQDSPYYFGFLLIAGMVMIFAGHFLNYKDGNDVNGKFKLLLALCFSIVFCTLISFNYICQTTFIRNIALNYQPEHASVVATFSMANPLSLSWAIEMWGYAFLGLSTALCSVYYRDRSNLIAVLMVLNGIVSVFSAVMTAANVHWVMTVGGLLAYFGWNVLMILMMILIYRETNSSRRQPKT